MPVAGPPEIFICPASGTEARENILHTVATAVPWASIASLASDETAEALEPVMTDGDLYFWGFRENSRIKRNVPIKPAQSWDRMPVGTLLLFTNQQNVTYMAVIGARLFDPVLSAALWGSDEFCWIVGLVNVTAVTDVTSADLRDAAGLGRVQMAMPIKPERHHAVLELLASSGMTESEVNSASDAAITVAPFDPDSPLSVQAEGQRRIEQRWLRNLLIPGQLGVCDLCGSEMPAAFLRAAHIKPRALCSSVEKLEASNVLVACVLCDVAFERGWITLDGDQQILISGTLPVTGELQLRLTHLMGRHVARPLKKSGVEFHREERFIP